VFAEAAAQGWSDHYREIAMSAEAFHDARYRRADGLFAYAADEHGEITTESALLYDQAFALLAWATMQRLGGTSYVDKAHALRSALAPLAHELGGFRENGEQPFQANAHMHLLEASLAWEEAGDATWRKLSDDIVDLALRRFIDPETGVLREFFDASWTPRDDAEGGLVEPGHQFEWAWLLDRWSRLRQGADVRPVAERLYRAGLRGVDLVRQVAVGSTWSDLRVRDAATRVWPQTEWLKAALIFGTTAEALQAAKALARFLERSPAGLWRERMASDGSLSDDACPATSLYHITGAILPLLRATARL
jgi:mannose-6-phosphate isomerase